MASNPAQLHRAAAIAFGVAVAFGTWWALSLFVFGVRVDEQELVGHTRPIDVVLCALAAISLVVALATFIAALRAQDGEPIDRLPVHDPSATTAPSSDGRARASAG